MGRIDATDEELTYYVVDDRRAIRSPWGRGNSKIGPRIYTYSRLPGRYGIGTCPGSTRLCESVCYSLRFQDNLPLWEWMRENTYRTGLPPLPSDAKVIRIHVSGDFDTKEYIEAWDRLCCENPKVQFFGYTRSWRIPELLHWLELLKSYANVELFASMDESTPETPPGGWRVAWLGAHTAPLEGTLWCPEEDGTKPNCEACGYCFRGKRGDVLFPIHEPTCQ